MMLPNRRILNFAGLFACAGMISYALFAQYQLLLDPCPLCVFQRIAVILLGLVFAITALHNPRRRGRRVYAFLILLAATAGAAVAGWHVRLQNLPADEVPSCGPGFDYIVGNFPLREALSLIFKGSGECADVAWQFLGLSMPAWVVITMLSMGVFGIWNNIRD